jgi:secreted Zn-dependent insulinase-like peptidase
MLRENLAELTQEEFSSQVEELAKVKLERPKRLREVASKDWREIDDGVERFDRQQTEVAELRKLTHRDLMEFFDKNILDESSRRKLTVHVQAASNGGGGEENQEKEKEISAVSNKEDKVEVVSADEVYKWKRSQELYPSLR